MLKIVLSVHLFPQNLLHLLSISRFEIEKSYCIMGIASIKRMTMGYLSVGDVRDINSSDAEIEQLPN